MKTKMPEWLAETNKVAAEHFSSGFDAPDPAHSIKMIVTGRTDRTGAKKALVELPPAVVDRMKMMVAGNLSTSIVELLKYALEKLEAEPQQILRDACK